MSTTLTTAVWKLRGIPATTKFIIIKIADNANDQGFCWPSVPKIAEECEVGERTVQGAIIWGEKHGLIKRDMRSGKSTIYYITPADYAPPQDMRPADYDNTPAVSAPPPPQIMHQPPQITASHIENRKEPQFEPSIEPSTRAREVNPDLKTAFDEWNRLAGELGLPKASHLNPTRKASLQARLRECDGLQGWGDCMAKIRGSPFLRGETGKFRATFDWIIGAKNFTKIMEGNYDDQPNGSQAKPSARSENGFAALLRECAEERAVQL